MVAALLLASAALWRARSLSRRLDRLTESYWELRYENGQMKARVARLELSAGLREAEPEPAASQKQTTTTFVSLASLKK